MSTYDYLSVLLSIVVGLGLSRLLSSLGELILQRRRVRFDWIALAAAGVVFVALVEFWWSAFGFQRIVAWNFFSFGLLLLVSVCLSLLSVLVLPDPTAEDSVDLGEHFAANHRWFFGVAALYLVLDVAFDLLVSGQRFAQPVRYFQGVFFVLLTTAAAKDSGRLQRLVVLAILLLFLVQIALLGLRIG